MSIGAAEIYLIEMIIETFIKPHNINGISNDWQCLYSTQRDSRNNIKHF